MKREWETYLHSTALLRLGISVPEAHLLRYSQAYKSAGKCLQGEGGWDGSWSEKERRF